MQSLLFLFACALMLAFVTPLQAHVLDAKSSFQTTKAGSVSLVEVKVGDVVHGRCAFEFSDGNDVTLTFQDRNGVLTARSDRSGVVDSVQESRRCREAAAAPRDLANTHSTKEKWNSNHVNKDFEQLSKHYQASQQFVAQILQDELNRQNPSNMVLSPSQSPSSHTLTSSGLQYNPTYSPVAFPYSYHNGLVTYPLLSNFPSWRGPGTNSVPPLKGRFISSENPPSIDFTNYALNIPIPSRFNLPFSFESIPFRFPVPTFTLSEIPIRVPVLG